VHREESLNLGAGRGERRETMAEFAGGAQRKDREVCAVEDVADVAGLFARQIDRWVMQNAD
jgi:hypothetical protein